MHKHYSETEIKKMLKEITVICDTREQVNYNITSYFDKEKISHVERALNAGDYSFMWRGYTFERDVVFERKANLDELAGNMVQRRIQFANEFSRARAYGTRVYLLIEGASWGDIWAHNYEARLNPNAMYATLLEWQARYNITIVFCHQKDTGRLIYDTFYYWLMNVLKDGKCPGR